MILFYTSVVFFNVKKILYLVMWLILYDEYLATLPDPWGYFQY